jgi:hypothetical protein
MIAAASCVFVCRPPTVVSAPAVCAATGVRAGPQPGVTRQVSSILVSRSPHIYLIDSPGIMLPKIDEPETGLRLAVTGVWRGVMGRCAALRCVALRCVALRCAALRCAALRCAALRCAALRCAALRCAALRGVAWRGMYAMCVLAVSLTSECCVFRCRCAEGQPPGRGMHGGLPTVLLEPAPGHQLHPGRAAGCCDCVISPMRRQCGRSRAWRSPIDVVHAVVPHWVACVHACVP